MLIIVEGPDGGGKSMLMEELRHVPEATCFSMLGGRTMEHAEMRSRTYQVIRRSAEGEKIICERFHPISDLVYRANFGGPRAFSQFEFDQMFSSGALGCPIILYCRPPLEHAMSQELKKAGDDTDDWLQTVGAGIEELYGSYDTLMLMMQTRSQARVIRYDYTEAAQAKLIRRWFRCAD